VSLPFAFCVTTQRQPPNVGAALALISRASPHHFFRQLNAEGSISMTTEETDMMNVKASKAVNVPVERAWEVIADFAHVDRCHPLVESVTMRSDAARGLGAIRVCNFYDKTSVAEKIVRWQEGESYTIELSEFSLPLKSAAATLSVRATGKDTSELRMLMDFTPKFGPLGWVMGKLMMRPMMTKMLNRVLAGIAQHALTGEDIGETWQAPVGDPGAVPA
jgi:carbon monoxide dehydrogenase subunit G